MVRVKQVRKTNDPVIRSQPHPPPPRAPGSAAVMVSRPGRARGASCCPLLQLLSLLALLTGSSATQSSPAHLASSSSSTFPFYSLDNSVRAGRPVWLPEHVFLFRDIYQQLPGTLSFRKEPVPAGNTLNAEEEEGGGGGEGVGGGVNNKTAEEGEGGESASSSLSSGIIVVKGSSAMHPKGRNQRLPAVLRPTHYVVRVQPFIHGNYSIRGSVQIEMEVLQATTSITLHMSHMEIHTQHVQLEAAEGDEGGGSVPRITQFLYDLDLNFFTARLEAELRPGRRLRYTIPYEGTLMDHMAGFYGVQYEDVDGAVRHLVSSMHQPIDARKAFPCFDEPELKATFELHVARETNMTAISNMPLDSTIPLEGQEGWVWDRFQTTPPMSTYLLMLVVSPLPHVAITAPSRPHLPIRVWARHEVLHKIAYLQQVVPPLLDYLESYTNLSFSLPKLDIVTIPEQKGAAFEGWGIVFVYDENIILYDPQEDDNLKWLMATSVMAHELAHQWFGNLVTPRWWSDEWLSEGVTTYMTDLVLRETGIVETKALEENELLTLEIFHEDHKEGVTPVRNEDMDVFDAWSFFTFTAYYKGYVVLHMLEHVLSPHVFRRGLVSLLHEHQYGSVAQDDLSRHLTEAAHAVRTLPQDLRVETIMNTWTRQTGYPLVTVTRSPAGTSATVYQERYLLPGEAGDPFSTWWVPLTYTSQDSPDFNDTRVKAWLKDTETQTSLPHLPGKSQWVIFNVQQTGYYRVNYDQHNWNLLIKQMLTDHRHIHIKNRVQMIDDILNLAFIGKVSYKTALSFVEYMKNETETAAWRALQHNIEHIKNMLKNTPAYEGFKKYMWSLLVPLWKIFGLDNQTEVQAMQREHSEVVQWACDLGLPDCVHLASSLYAQWMLAPNDMKLVPEELREAVYCTAIANGGEAEWDFGWRQYFLTNDHHHKDQLLRALGCTNNQWREMRYLALAFTSGVRLQPHDAFQVFRSVASRPGGEHLAWSFLTRRWPAVSTLYGGSGKTTKKLVVTAARTFTSRQDMAKLLRFKDRHHHDPHVVAASEVALDFVARNIAWMERSYEGICEWLDEHGFDSTPRAFKGQITQENLSSGEHRLRG